MTREKLYNELRPVGADPKNLTTPQVQAWLTHDLGHTELMRSILMAEIQAVKAGADREIRTMRGLWYEVAKPLISRAGELYRPKTTSGKPVDWDGKYISEGLTELVRAGITSYEELKIIDGSRQRQKAQAIATQLVDVEMVGDHYPWVILFIEKDTVWPIVQSIANLYGVSAISGGGQPSNACSENITRAIIRSASFKRHQPQYIELLAITDYDPAGYIIAESQENQLIEAFIGSSVSDDPGRLLGVRLSRIGIRPDQLSAAEIQANSYRPAKSGLRDWYRETGGINGQPLGLELDSLPLSRLRSLFAAEIEKHIDLTPRYNDLRKAFIELMASYELLPEFNRRREELINKAGASQVGQAIKGVQLPTNLFYQAAINGVDWIGPRQTLDLFSDYQEQLTELWNGNQ